MYLIQISDLHLGDCCDLKLISKKIDSFFESVQQKVSPDEEVILCVLGDIINGGNASACKDAIEIINYIKCKFCNYLKFKIVAVPGNHDICADEYGNLSFHTFNVLCNEFDYFCKGDCACVKVEFDEADLLLVNSVFHRDYKCGYVDIDEIKKIIITKNTFIVMHHSIFGIDKFDMSAIKDGYSILNYVEKNKISGILHGHTHGYRNVVIGNDCRIVGVGSFLKQVDDINNQCNIIHVDHNGIYSIDNFFYQGDFKEYKSQNVFTQKPTEIYSGVDLSDIYAKIKSDVQKDKIIQNFCMKVKFSLEEFESQVNKYFSDNIKDAYLWQSKELPDNLYYNHRQFMQSKNKDGIDFVVDELNAKPTSSRAVIPLIDYDRVINSGDGYLPSFNIVQFGFNDDSKTKLIITLYLRALEVNFFLKINLCELLLMAKEISESIRSVQDVDMNIYAFRAQYKEKFGCFVKAKIDTLSSADILMLICHSEFENIISLLKEKNDFCETIVNKKGILELRSAFNAVATRKKIVKRVFSLLDHVEKSMDELECERCKTSNYAAIAEKENMTQRAFCDLITLFESGELYENI
ncbi:metallophosphoesterase [Desulfovibrio desulfuricans]|uniref:metallophosphoesterase family protein n=1 Tax=Desulfovibrio desulfuricans TaxID=876 RepID=UPI001781D334|nr:metallophosphoesterase [Desulfovibrio desulfuricans]MBD8894835.1 metallophosphoesterase [Desulfovibrio desulfuricans]